MLAKITWSPPAARFVPLPSLSCTVIVDVLLPSAAIVVGAAVIVDVVGLAFDVVPTSNGSEEEVGSGAFSKRIRSP